MSDDKTRELIKHGLAKVFLHRCNLDLGKALEGMREMVGDLQRRKNRKNCGTVEQLEEVCNMPASDMFDKEHRMLKFSELLCYQMNDNLRDAFLDYTYAGYLTVRCAMLMAIRALQENWVPTAYIKPKTRLTTLEQAIEYLGAARAKPPYINLRNGLHEILWEHLAPTHSEWSDKAVEKYNRYAKANDEPPLEGMEYDTLGYKLAYEGSGDRARREYELIVNVLMKPTKAATQLAADMGVETHFLHARFFVNDNQYDQDELVVMLSRPILWDCK